MDRKKTSKMPRFCLSDIPITKITHREGIVQVSAKDAFMDSEKVMAVLLECIIENDTETFSEILDSYLRIKLSTPDGGV